MNYFWKFGKYSLISLDKMQINLYKSSTYKQKIGKFWFQNDFLKLFTLSSFWLGQLDGIEHSALIKTNMQTNKQNQKNTRLFTFQSRKYLTFPECHPNLVFNAPWQIFYSGVYFCGCIRYPQVNISVIPVNPLEGNKNPWIFYQNMVVIDIKSFWMWISTLSVK